MAVSMAMGRDAKWLTLEVCREFQRGTCSRSDGECKFAHPSRSCHVENGRVIACFDSLKGRCTRENCKYLHPPPHLKTQLEINGRNNLIQQKTAAAMLAQQMQYMLPGPQLQPITTFSVTPSLAASPSMAFSPYLSHINPAMSLVPELLPSAPVLVPGSPANPAQKHLRTDKLEVCREFQRGNCTRGENDCRYAHPPEPAMVDSSENSVVVCMDYIKGRCSRDKCKYFHPPAHLQAKIKAAQHQTSQSAAMVSPAPRSPAVTAKEAGPGEGQWGGHSRLQPQCVPLSAGPGQHAAAAAGLISHSSHDARCHALHCYVSHNTCHQCSVCQHTSLQSVDPCDVLSTGPVDLQCVPVETQFHQFPKFLVPAQAALNPVSLSRNPR